jgi:hypothetical protein
VAGLAAALVLLLVACAGGRAQAPDVGAVAAVATGLATAMPAPATAATAVAGATPAPPAIPVTEYAREPLAALSPEAAAFLAGRPGLVTVGVVVPARRVIYVANPDTAVQTASVIKVAIMMDVLARAAAEGRAVSDGELALLTPMITNSDNDSATALWNAVGGGEGLSAYLARIGVAGIEPNPSDCWGASKATGAGVATLLGRLAFDDVLPAPERAIALELLAHVDPAQRWGAIAGTPSETPDGTMIGVKDGWYPADCGWWAGSTAIVIPGPTAPPGAAAYSLAVMTAQHPTLEDAVATIEGVAALVHDALHGAVAPAP